MTIKVRIYTESPSSFRAEIAGGWWVARGPTKEAAKRKVVKRCMGERGRRAGRS
jgi:hypothetical protein